MKKLFSLLFFMNISIGLYSQENNTIVNIKKNDGNIVSFLLVNQPQMTFSADSVTLVEAVTGLSDSYLRSDIEDITFCKQIASDIIEPNTKNNHLFIELLDRNTISVRGINNPLSIFVYDISGRKHLPIVTFDGDGNASIDISSLPIGIYIVNVEDESFKIRK